jgi:hypothetical protein
VHTPNPYTVQLGHRITPDHLRLISQAFKYNSKLNRRCCELNAGCCIPDTSSRSCHFDVGPYTYLSDHDVSQVQVAVRELTSSDTFLLTLVHHERKSFPHFNHNLLTATVNRAGNIALKFSVVLSTSTRLLYRLFSPKIFRTVKEEERTVWYLIHA